MPYPTKYLFLSLLVISMIISCTSTNHQQPNQKQKSISFTKHIVYDTFISEGVAYGDVNQDGKEDILSGFYWFEAPDWKIHEIKPPVSYDYTKGYSQSFLNFTIDVNFDGWPDLVSYDFPGQGVYWYENPKGEEKHWKEHLIDSNACNESPAMTDLDDDGRMDLIFGHEEAGTMMWLKAPATAEDLTWEALAISEPNSPGTHRFSHGLGISDVNGDGRKDIIIREGWWEAPADRSQVPWTFHETALGEPCSQMYAYDFDNDGDQDVISASAHAYGIWWHENISENDHDAFQRHLIDSSFSQTHGVAFTDMNGDGLPDLITGKRFYAHQGKDPGGKELAVLYWFEFSRDENNHPKWIPHLIDDNSGAGLQVVIVDINKDGKPDILNANKKGIIYFLQE